MGKDWKRREEKATQTQTLSMSVCSPRATQERWPGVGVGGIKAFHFAYTVRAYTGVDCCG